jgi:hypothetical protein
MKIIGAGIKLLRRGGSASHELRFRSVFLIFINGLGRLRRQ